MNELIILIVKDADIVSSTSLAEWFLLNEGIDIDFIISTGPLCPQNSQFQVSTLMQAQFIADITTTIAHLEDIVCRVAYCPCRSDPPQLLCPSPLVPPRLTPNSLNIFERCLRLCEGLEIRGISKETGDIDSDDEDVGGMVCPPRVSTITILNQSTYLPNVVLPMADIHEGESSLVNGISIDDDAAIPHEWKGSHLEKSIITILPLPHIATPTVISNNGNIYIIPGSLRSKGEVLVLRLSVHSLDPSSRWGLDSITRLCIPLIKDLPK